MGSSHIIIEAANDRVEANVPLAQDVTPGTTVLMSATLARRHKAKGMLFTMSADGRVQFFSGTTPITGNMHFSATGGMVEVDLETLVVADYNQDLKIVTTGGAANGVVKVVTEP